MKITEIPPQTSELTNHLLIADICKHVN